METLNQKKAKTDRNPDDPQYAQLSLPFMKDYPPAEPPADGRKAQSDESNGNTD